MIKNIKYKLLFILIITIIAFLYIIPSFYNIPNILNKSLKTEKLRLGLDLQGGIHLLLEVDTQKSIDNFFNRFLNEIQKISEKNNFNIININKYSFLQISFEINSNNKDAEKILKNIINKQYPEFKLDITTSLSKTKIILTITEKKIKECCKNIMNQTIENIRNRIDQFGINEPEILQQGKNLIAIQIPGIKNTQKAIELIGKMAKLEFMLIDEKSHALGLQNNSDNFVIPSGDIFLKEIKLNKITGENVEIPYLIKNIPVITGNLIETAHVVIGNNFQERFVSIIFTPQGAQELEKITSENLNKRLAIILDNKICSVALIKEKISGGQAQITGSFSEEEAKILAIALRSGSLPAPVKIIEELTIGPSLGQDSIEKGVFSVLIGGFLVMIFMFIYYRLSGLIANIALILNVIFIIATLIFCRATLTLPGIVGIVLTMGIAVDANVLIFERIREELKKGLTLYTSLNRGFSKAFITILDTHITTLISALFLFYFGIGPIKGFAVTLSIGIIYSIFTAVFVTRIIFNYLLIYKKIKSIGI